MSFVNYYFNKVINIKSNNGLIVLCNKANGSFYKGNPSHSINEFNTYKFKHLTTTILLIL